MVTFEKIIRIFLILFLLYLAWHIWKALDLNELEVLG